MHKHDTYVSVILPIYRIDAYCKSAIESILKQTFRDFELLIIANQDVCDQLNIFTDSRVRFIQVPKNWNLSMKLNFGIKKSNGKYIVRMDSDDLSYPDRISEQVMFMEKNQNIDISGTAIRFIGNIQGHRIKEGNFAFQPEKHELIEEMLLTKNALFHPTVIIRKETFINSKLSYNEAYCRAQDYELWTKAVRKLNLGNLQKILLDYRLHPGQIGVTDSYSSAYFSDKAKLKYCIKSIFSFDKLSIKALKLLRYRMKNYVLSLFNYVIHK